MVSPGFPATDYLGGLVLQPNIYLRYQLSKT
jgi:hypothetical protein